MKSTINLVVAILVAGGFLALAAPTMADSRDRRRDVRELEAARRELRRDLRRGASRAEIARDRAAIARERRDLRRAPNDWWRNDRYDHEGGYNRWNRWHRYDDRWSPWHGRDRGWRRG